MKITTLILVILFPLFIYSQCNQYFIYESFSSSIPNQKGTWTPTSMTYGTSPIRTGSHALVFNATGDAIRTPQITNPGVLTLWHRRSTNTTAWTLNIQTSPNGTSWTTRGSVTTTSTTWTQYTLNIGSLGLTNVFVRLVDARASGIHERYVDDFAITSTDASENTYIPFVSSCNETLNSSYTYIITDDIGPNSGNYGNSINRTFTFTPSDPGTKLNLLPTQLDLEIDYDFIYVYDGPSTSSPLLAKLDALSPLTDVQATNPSGQLTVQWTTDISNVGTWTGFSCTITSIVALPVELLYFEGTSYPLFNILKWSTASERNSLCFELERSTDGEIWRQVTTKQAAGNSNSNIDYSYVDYMKSIPLCYYRLNQVDIDGESKIYGPIAIQGVPTKRVVKYINTLNQEVGPEYKGVVIEIYEDGTSKKTIR